MNKQPQGPMGDIINTVVKSYREHPALTQTQIGYLPSRDAVVQAIKLLREMLFPGYFGRQNFVDGTIEYHIGALLVDVHELLSEQIALALTREAMKAGRGTVDIGAKAEELCRSFLSTLPKIRDILDTDVQAAYDGDPAARDKDEVIFSYPGVFAVSVYRLAHELYTLGVPLIPRIMTEYAHSETGIDIHAGARIGEYFFIDHGTGVVIGETTEIGDYVKIYQGVTLGALSTRGGQTLRGAKRHPTLEDEVTVYSGASILGGETVIGKGVVIGSNAFITKSVPNGTKVSVKNPELVFKGRIAEEFIQDFIPDWVI